MVQLGGVGRRLGALGEIWESFSFFSAGAACAVLCVSWSRVEWSPVCGCAAVALEPPRKPKSLAEFQWGPLCHASDSSCLQCLLDSSLFYVLFRPVLAI